MHLSLTSPHTFTFGSTGRFSHIGWRRGDGLLYGALSCIYGPSNAFHCCSVEYLYLARSHSLSSAGPHFPVFPIPFRLHSATINPQLSWIFLGRRLIYDFPSRRSVECWMAKASAGFSRIFRKLFPPSTLNETWAILSIGYCLQVFVLAPICWGLWPPKKDTENEEGMKRKIR